MWQAVPKVFSGTDGNVLFLQIIRQGTIQHVPAVHGEGVRLDGHQIQSGRQDHPRVHKRFSDQTGRCLPGDATKDICCKFS